MTSQGVLKNFSGCRAVCAAPRSTPDFCEPLARYVESKQSSLFSTYATSPSMMKTFVPAECGSG